MAPIQTGLSRRLLMLATCLGFSGGCGTGTSSPAAGGAGQTAASAGGTTATGGANAEAGTTAGAGGSVGPGGTAGSAGNSSPGGTGGTGGAVVQPPAMGTPGVWEDVTSPEMDPALFTPPSGFGVGNIRVDPARPTDLYAGGYGSIWKSTDYGLTWARVDSKPNPPYLALGHVLAVAGTTPATLWMANVSGAQKVFKSTDGGLTFTLTGTITVGSSNESFYSIVVDPNDATHLLTGLHEQDNLLESKDGGETWQVLGGAGWPAGGRSWFPFFVNAGDAAKTS